MASLVDLRLAPVTARDGFDTRNKDLNVARDDTLECFDASADVTSPVTGKPDMMDFDDIEAFLAADIAFEKRAQKINNWLKFCPEMEMEFVAPFAMSELEMIGSVWNNWRRAAEPTEDSQRYAELTSGYNSNFAENSYYAELESAAVAAGEKWSYAHGQLALNLCKYNRELASFHRTVAQEKAQAREADYRPAYVDSALDMIKIAADRLRRMYDMCSDTVRGITLATVKIQQAFRYRLGLTSRCPCGQKSTTQFLHLTGIGFDLCDSCFSRADHGDLIDDTVLSACISTDLTVHCHTAFSTKN